MEMNLEMFLSNNLNVENQLLNDIAQRTLKTGNTIVNAIVYTALVYNTGGVVLMDPQKLIAFEGEKWEDKDIKEALDEIKAMKVRLGNEDVTFDTSVANMVFYKKERNGEAEEATVVIGIMLNPIFQKIYSLWQQ
ncbi:hypothetical protein ACQQ97_07040 [Anaerovoracaceae bacterium SGI.195]